MRISVIVTVTVVFLAALVFGVGCDNELPHVPANDIVDPPSPRVPLWMFLIPPFVVAVVLLLAIRTLLGRVEDHSHDSSEFLDALDIWYPVVLARTNSLRQFKRFVNNVRFMANLARSSWRDNASTAVLGESLMVALAALQSLHDGTEAENVEGPIPLCVVAGFTDAQPLSKDANPEFSAWVHSVIKELEKELVPQDQTFRDNVLEILKTALETHQRCSRERATVAKIKRYNSIARLV